MALQEADALRNDLHQRAVSVVAIEEILDRGVRVPVDDEQVQQAIVVIVRPGAAEGNSALIHNRTRRYWDKIEAANVVVQCVLGTESSHGTTEISHEQIDVPVAVIIPPTGIEGDSAVGRDWAGSDLLKGAIAIVVIQETGSGDKSLPGLVTKRSRNPSLSKSPQAHAEEFPPSVTMLPVVILAKVPSPLFRYRKFWPPGLAVGDEQIVVTIVVVVAPSATFRNARIRDYRAGGDLGEGRIDLERSRPRW